MTNTEYLRARLLRGVDTSPIGHKTTTLDELRGMQWSEDFTDAMRPRMHMGYFRYGDVRKQTGRYNNVGSAITRLKLFQATGNEEHLVDVANLCMVEFMQKNHPNAHFESADDGIHVEAVK